jgi:hypothetical protein
MSRRNGQQGERLIELLNALQRRETTPDLCHVRIVRYRRSQGAGRPLSRW